MKYFAIFEKNVERIFQTYFCNILCYVGICAMRSFIRSRVPISFHFSHNILHHLRTGRVHSVVSYFKQAAQEFA